MLNVPAKFQPMMPFPYPAHNQWEFERWYYTNLTQSETIKDRIYLPIFWTAYYVNKNISKITPYNSPAFAAFHVLQEYIDSLDRSLSYYTIVQHDDGILNNISALDIKVFHMSGVKGTFNYRDNYPLPLIAEPHEWKHNNKRTYMASFIGGLTHPIRKQMSDLYKHDNDILFSSVKTPQKTYCEIMSRSVFALCPRGYGPTSFRIQEAIQYGAIPVYISDYFVEPYNIDFNSYGVKIGFDQIKDLRLILQCLKEAGGTNLASQSMEHYYTYIGCKEMILKNLL